MEKDLAKHYSERPYKNIYICKFKIQCIFNKKEDALSSQGKKLAAYWPGSSKNKVLPI